MVERRGNHPFASADADLSLANLRETLSAVGLDRGRTESPESLKVRELLTC